MAAKISVAITALFAFVGFDVSQKAIALQITVPGGSLGNRKDALLLYMQFD